MKYFLWGILGVILLCLNSSIANGAPTGDSCVPHPHNWLKIDYESYVKPRIFSIATSEIDSVFYEAVRNNHLNAATDIITNISVVSSGQMVFTIPIDSISSIRLDGNIPTIFIDTRLSVPEITSKTQYLDASLRYVPYGDGTDTLEAPVQIRGRGNSSWEFPKKPYRLKFDKKQSLGGLSKAKSFVLIANYIDNTLMRNAVAFKIAELLGLPYTNIPKPVNVVFNGVPRGSYMLTNKIGINAGSVDIDESEGILWELDAFFDEDYRFRSSAYYLPCMVKDPDFGELAEGDSDKIDEMWNYWRQDLENSILSVREGNWQEAFDAEQFVKYILVNDIVHNPELSYPKSVYLYKENKEGKYKMGPVWDFDWAMGYNSYAPVGIIENVAGNYGYSFFVKIFRDEEFRAMFEKELEDFCEHHLSELMVFIDEYASMIRDSAIYDAMLWPLEHNDPREANERHAFCFEENVEWLKDWILHRIEGMKASPNYLLY